jgi:hypothetical protein
MHKQPQRRIADPSAMRSHPFFNGIDWKEVFEMRAQPEWQPTIDET